MTIMQLPQEFVLLMREQYGTDTADALCHALLETEPEVSVRLNPRKGKPLIIDPTIHTESVLWCPDAYYLSERPAFTFDPLLHAGVYYVQEASSMYVAELLRKFLIQNSEFRIQNCDSTPSHLGEGRGEGPQVALDLCAAPGGKSTLLAGLLPEGSVLVSNEPIAKRAQILSENMQKWTRVAEGEYPVRCYVTQNYPADFVAFSDTFDLLVTDVPCSGEGMFRKDEVAIKDWNLENVERCWQRQREIMHDIWHVLKPGALLIYSTCTFNHFEDEDNVRWICDTLGGELLEERHFLPGRDRGEGFYCAAIRKTSLPRPLPRRGEGLGRLEDVFTSLGGGRRGCTLNVLPPAFTTDPDTPRVELNYNEALQYLRREAVRVPAPRGMVLLCYKGYVLGPGKCVGNRINNLYPDQWRIRTTYTTPFTLAD
jgi:16S rRNA C967 or C1407 C5-methylase (RsmB/RsmF family)